MSAALVIPRIFAAIDDHRFDDLPAFYVPDVEAETVMGHISGRDALVGTLRAVHEPIPVLQHLVTGVLVDEHDDTADVRANVVAIFCDAEHHPTMEGASVWRGGLRRVDGTWQVARFDLSLVWTRGELAIG